MYHWYLIACNAMQCYGMFIGINQKRKEIDGENSLITHGMWFTITQLYSSCFQDVGKGMSLQYVCMYDHNLFFLTIKMWII